MSRSNGPATQPATQPGGWPQQRPAGNPQEQDAQAWHAAQQNRWPPQQPYPAAQPSNPAQGFGASHQPGYGGFPGAVPAEHFDYTQQPTQPPAYPYAQPDQQAGYARAPHVPGREATGQREVTGAPAGPLQHATHTSSYAPQFDPYSPPGNPGTSNQAFGASAAYGHPGQGSGHPAAYTQELSSLQRAPNAGHNGAPSFAPPSDVQPFQTADLRGAHYEQSYDQWQQPAPQPAHELRGADPRGYDMGGYMAAAAPDPGRRIPSPELSHAEWGLQTDPYQGHAAQQEPQFDMYGQPRYPSSGQSAANASAMSGALAQAGNGGYDLLPPRDDASRPGQLAPTYQQDPNFQQDEAEYEIEEPKAGRRWGLIAAALVGAIALGGGATYGYKTLYGATTGKPSAAPVVKNDGVPAKVKPAEPGGKQFAHTDSKIMGRLNDNSGTAAASAAATSSDTDAAGSRKVQTMVVRPDGSILPAAAPAEPPRQQAAAAVSVPGMTIVDGFGGRPPAAALAAPAAAAPPVAPAAARPVVVTPPAAAVAAPPAAAKQPVVVAKAPAPAAADVEVQPEPKKVAVPKKPVIAAPAPATATGGNGFVAVLASVPASQKSSMDALKQFADMQQKFGTTLANKTPEVREANLGEKGTYHRLLVGPPGSREQAGQLCSELKAAGYGSCWVTAY